jgi:hypothetical protein
VTHASNDPRRTSTRARKIAFGFGLALLILVPIAFSATTVPTDVQIPGTQPAGTDNVPNINSVGNCNCHDFTANQRPESAPVFGWTGGMMANAGRDPLFWSTVAIAEQDFLPGGGGVGDLCLHCHSVKGWIEGRSTPTNGSGLDPNTDTEGIMCEFCHLLTNPDQENTIPNPPEGAYHEEQNAPFVAYDEVTGEGYYGGAEYVLNSEGTRLGPYTDHTARHDAIPSAYHRDARLCGTCHDVSNPAVGDLAPNHGSMVPLPGRYSGVPNGPVADTAAMNNPPEAYGVVERTFTEWIASSLDTQQVNGYSALPPELQVAGGALELAYLNALNGTCSGSGNPCKVDGDCGGGEICTGLTADYADGQTRFYTCQTCHMSGSLDKGAKQGDVRGDLPAHDQTGGSYWVAEAIQWQDAHGTLRFGTGLDQGTIDAMTAAQARAEIQLRSAASLSASQTGNQVMVTVTNLTGHKLISGYPEGRRMWLNLQWYDAADQPLTAFENGAYGPIGNVVDDLSDPPQSFDVQSILDPSTTKVYEAKPAMTQEWASLLIDPAVGYPPGMILEWDRMTNTSGRTLGDLAAMAPGSMIPTFHFVLNNAIYKDPRIPPLGFDYDVAETRSALPVPVDQYGNPGSGGVYNHWDEVYFDIPPGAARVELHLYYQSTSWEYIQFLWLQNDGLDPFLGSEGVNMLDAWLNTSMSPPFAMAETTLALSSVVGVPGEASPQDIASDSMLAGWNGSTGQIDVSYTPACDATDHTIYYGDLSTVATYGYAGAECFVGVTGTASFDPGTGSVFFVVVANNTSNEGSYGKDSSGIERPEDTGTLVCDQLQDLAGVVCE